MNTDKKIKLIGTILGVLLFIVLIVGISYAWFNWRSGNVIISGNTECFPVIEYTKGQTISDESVLLFDEDSIIEYDSEEDIYKITIKKGMAVTDVTAYLDSSCDIRVGLEVILDVTELDNAFINGNSVGAFKYVIAAYDPKVYNDISTQTLNGQTFDFLYSGSITSFGENYLMHEEITDVEKGYLLIFYIDGDLTMNDAGNTEFSAVITGSSIQVE